MKHFFDIGANVGTTFDWLATQPHDYRDHIIWCCESSPRHFASLIGNVRHVREKYDVRICPFAVGGKRELRTLLEKDDPQGDSLFAWTKSDHETKNVPNGYAVTVAVIPLSDLLDQCTCDDDDVVLDIDAEGAEYDMLANLWAHPYLLKRIRRMMIEWHFIDGKNCAARKLRFCADFASCGINIENRGFVP